MWIYKLSQRKRLKNEFILSFLISTLPLLAALCYYLIVHWYDIWSYEFNRKVSLIATSLWTYIGPIMVVRWMKSTKSIVDTIDELKWANGCGNEVFLHEFRHLRWRNVLFSLLWTILVVSVLIIPSGCEVLKSYYFDGYSDWTYWAFILCVSYIVYLTSFFFLFLWVSWKLIIKITNNDIVMSELLLNEGKSNSLVLFGDLISRSILYFCTGLLFFPILIQLFLESLGIKNNGTFMVFILMGIYLIIMLLYFYSMNKHVSGKSQKVKDSIIKNLIEESDKVETGTTREFILDERIRYVAGLKTNPVLLDQYLKLLYGIIISGFLPAVFAVII